METMQTIPEWKAGADEIWAILREVSQSQKESARKHEEIDRIIKEISHSQKETDRIVKETAQRQKETDKQIGKLGNRFGEMVEYMVVPNLTAKFRELDFEFETTSRDKEIKDQRYNIITEVDVFLENGDRVMIVEIKTKPSVEDINDHIERMETLRAYADLHNDKRKYLGAVAGVVFGKSEKVYAFKKGFYAVEPSGDTFTITPPSGEYHPREW